MKKFIATPFDQYGHWIVERFNETSTQYERYDPKVEDEFLSEAEAKQKAEQCNYLYDRDIANK